MQHIPAVALVASIACYPEAVQLAVGIDRRVRLDAGRVHRGAELVDDLAIGQRAGLTHSRAMCTA